MAKIGITLNPESFEIMGIEPTVNSPIEDTPPIWEFGPTLRRP